MPSNFSLRVMNGAHRFVIAITGGRFGWFMYGMPMLELTTTGRKSGEKRSTMLSSPMRVHGSYLVVASRGGDDTHPAWFLNLRDDPHVEVVIQGGAKEPRIARIATARRAREVLASNHREVCQLRRLPREDRARDSDRLSRARLATRERRQHVYAAP